MSGEAKEMAFDAALKKLESLVESLESGELSLEDALKKYEEGVKLADFCTKRLSEAEKKVELLMKTNPGRFKTEPLESKGETKKRK